MTPAALADVLVYLRLSAQDLSPRMRTLDGRGLAVAQLWLDQVTPLADDYVSILHLHPGAAWQVAGQLGIRLPEHRELAGVARELRKLWAERPAVLR